MRISFRSKHGRFTLTTGEDDIDAAEQEEALEYVELVGSFDLAPSEADYEDATYVIPDDDEEEGCGGSRAPHSIGFAPRA